MKQALTLLVVLGGLTAQGPAHAQEAAAKQSSAPHTHDGFYLQFSLGGGYAHDDLKYEGIFGFASFEGKGEGPSAMFDARAGYALKPGLILGGGLFVEQVANPKVTFEGQDVSSDVSMGTFVLFGPLIDWYPDAKAGFHLGGAIGGSRITMKDENDEKLDNQPVGGGAVFYLGYDWWVGDEWSLGVELRGTGATMYDGSTNVRHTWSSGGVVATLVYN